MKRLICLIVLMPFFIFSVSAESGDNYYTYYSSSGLSSLEDLLPKEVGDTLDELEIDLSSYSSIINLDTASFITLLKSYIKDGFKAPFSAFLLSTCVLIMCSMVGGIFSKKLQMSETYTYVCMLSLMTVVLLPFVNSATSLISASKSLSVFMLSFIPVFAGVLIMGGSVTMGGVYSATMLLVSNTITNALSFFVSPIITIYISLGISSVLSGIEGAYLLSMRIKSGVNWCLGFVMTIFSGLLSIQSAVAKSADNLAIKTTKFVIGSSVPVAGGALGEALTTVTASMGILRTAAMSWCILVIAVIILPPLIELCLWRISLSVLSSVAHFLSLPDAAKLMDICSAAAGFIFAIILTITAIFIISLAVLGGAS